MNFCEIFGGCFNLNGPRSPLTHSVGGSTRGLPEEPASLRGPWRGVCVAAEVGRAGSSGTRGGRGDEAGPLGTPPPPWST